MIKHHCENKKPDRVVILGASGFLGKSLKSVLEQQNVPILTLGRSDLDLSEEESAEKLTRLLKPTDALLFFSTVTPDKGRGLDAFVKNIKMGEIFCNALKKVAPSHVIYLSSDTVYPLHRGLISEESPADPENLFGVMHLSREYMIKASTTVPTAILRSTLVYGAADTHNSYGPNRMRRMAQKERKITLFGEGEERRDHIFVNDVASIIALVLFHRSEGILNLVTGQSISYKELAQKTASLFDVSIEIVSAPRNNPITHRHFDATAIHKSFPFFQFTSLDEGLKRAFQEEFIHQFSM